MSLIGQLGASFGSRAQTDATSPSSASLTIRTSSSSVPVTAPPGSIVDEAID